MSKEVIQKNKDLLKEIRQNKETDNKAEKDGTLFWRKGNDKGQLGDFVRQDIMTGPYGKQVEATELKHSVNEKTGEMYKRYFETKNNPKGLDSDPVVKEWVKNGDQKATAIAKQVEKSHAGYKANPDAAHMAHLNKQRGR